MGQQARLERPGDEEAINASEKQENSLYNTAGYVLVYIWAFGIVNSLWWFFYTFIGHWSGSSMLGLTLFWVQLPIYLGMYLFFVYKCSLKYSFYSFDTEKYSWAA